MKEILASIGLLVVSFLLQGQEITDRSSERLFGNVRLCRTMEYQTSEGVTFSSLDDADRTILNLTTPHSVRTVSFTRSGSYKEIVQQWDWGPFRYSKSRWHYDEKGQPAKIEYIGENGQPNGSVVYDYSRRRWIVIRQYDAKGQIVEAWIHVMRNNREYKETIGYKTISKARVVTKYYYNRLNQLIRIQTKVNGYVSSEVINSYASSGRIDNEITRSKDGIRQVFYDANGIRTKEIEWPAAGGSHDPMTRGESYEMIVSDFDGRITTTAFARDGSIGYLQVTELDSSGNSILSMTEDGKGTYVRKEIARYEYDNIGNWIHMEELHMDYKRNSSVYLLSDREIEYYK